jgi:RIO-like serine/threonine protein kinase
VSSQPDTSAEPSLTRARLLGWPATVLKDEGEGAARIVRFDLPDGGVILKEWAPRKSRLLALWARMLMRREIRHYRRLAGCPGIPPYLGHEGDAALMVRYVEARPIHRKLPPELLRTGLDDLERVLSAMHERRFVHLDLHQKLNALIDAQGHAWLVDLGQGLDCSHGLLRRLIFPVLARVDLDAVLKFRARYAPETLEPAQRERLVARFGARRDRWPKRLGRALRRLVAGER